VTVEPSSVETNIVVFGVDDARGLAAELRAAGVDLLVVDENHLRAVTHLGVPRPAVEAALSRIGSVLE
jgi:hypothetical protein